MEKNDILIEEVIAQDAVLVESIISASDQQSAAMTGDDFKAWLASI